MYLRTYLAESTCRLYHLYLWHDPIMLDIRRVIMLIEFLHNWVLSKIMLWVQYMILKFQQLCHTLYTTRHDKINHIKFILLLKLDGLSLRFNNISIIIYINT